MIFITGPTSSGKTSLAIKMCKEQNGEIISADSRQIFKYMDVGTGKLPVSESDKSVEIQPKYWIIKNVKIWLYDVVTPDQFYSVTDFRKDAFDVIKDIKGRGKIPIVVGGTGLYIDALLGKLNDVKIPPDFKLRDELKNKTVSELQKMLPSDILEMMNNSDRNNPRRLIRKIEKLEEVTESKSKFMPLIPDQFILIDAKNEILYEKVDRWVEAIWEDLLKETYKLKEKGYGDTNPMQGIIYKTALEYLENRLAEEPAKDRIKYDLHAYIRRQKTWFKRYRESSFDSGIFKLVESSV